MGTSEYIPAREDHFSFGIWTVGWQGVDVFGSAVRPPMPAERAVRKLEQTLQLLQTQEDRLWFWCVDRSADPYVSDDMLREVGLRLDRRVEFPRRTENIAVAPEQRIPVGRLAPVQRALAESIGSGRVELSAS